MTTTPPITREQAAALLGRLRADPDFFLHTVLGSTTHYQKQLDIFKSVRDNRRTSVVGATSSGKDWATGRLLLWWLAIHDEAAVIVVGPTSRQVDEIVWREARDAYKKSKMPLGGRMFETSQYEIDAKRYALGFSTDKPFNLQGFHSPHLLVIVTEAHNVSDDHFHAIEYLNAERVILTGNALSVSGEFYRAHNTRDGMYHTIKIEAKDTPNIQQGRVVIPGMLTVADVEDKRRKLGEDSPEYRASVLAEFTLGGGRNYFDIPSVIALRDAHAMRPMEERLGGLVKIWKRPGVADHYVAGADCAWGEKGAYSVLTIAHHRTLETVAEIYGRPDRDELASVGVKLCREYNNAFLGIERNGEGAAIVDTFIDLGYGSHMYHRHDDWQEKKENRGWLTDARTRPILLEDLNSMFRNRGMFPHCEHFFDEALTFVRDEVKNKPLPAPGHYADHLFAQGIMLQVRSAAQFFVTGQKPLRRSYAWSGR